MTKFIIFSCGFNCEDFLEKHIDSVRSQTYKNYRHILVDDFSNDSTYEKLCTYQDDQTLIFKTEKNQKWLHNSVMFLQPNIQDKEEVIAILDMDDWFAHEHVLEEVAEVYEETNCWLTYSKIQRSNKDAPDKVPPYSPHVIKQKLFRKSGWRLMSLKTFKAFLFQNINKHDFKGPNRDKYHTLAYDIALYMPMLEMCPADKLVYIPKVHYIYNVNNPNSVINKDFSIMRKRTNAEHFFRRKQSYKELKR